MKVTIECKICEQHVGIFQLQQHVMIPFIKKLHTLHEEEDGCEGDFTIHDIE